MTRHEYVQAVLEPRFKDENELYHHGILGMKWGVRRYQNEDGTLTEAGKKRYMTGDVNEAKRRSTAATVAGSLAALAGIGAIVSSKSSEKAVNRMINEMGFDDKIKFNSGHIASSAIIRAGKTAVVSGLITYGAVKLRDMHNKELRNNVKPEPSDSPVTKRTT
jgi:hypothetical protein